MGWDLLVNNNLGPASQATRVSKSGPILHLSLYPTTSKTIPKYSCWKWNHCGTIGNGVQPCWLICNLRISLQWILYIWRLYTDTWRSYYWGVHTHTPIQTQIIFAPPPYFTLVWPLIDRTRNNLFCQQSFVKMYILLLFLYLLYLIPNVYTNGWRVFI